MKNMTNIISRMALWAGAAVVLSFGIISCEDEPDRYRATEGVPSISYIRPANAAASDSLLTGAYMGNAICIVGENLTSIYELWFNDQQATLNTSYMTDHTLLVDVPNRIPEEVSNLITMKTKKGDVVEYGFNVLVPGPTLSSMSCEWAAPGSVATIYGDYFIDDPNVPLTITFPDDVKVTQINEINKNYVSFVVPEGATEGTVDVSTIYGEATSGFHYMDTRGIMFEFDGLTGLTNHGWHPQVIESGPNSLSGNYLRLGDPSVTMDETGAWDDGHFSFEYWPGDWSDPTQYTGTDMKLTDLVDFSDWENMSLKFEMMVPSSNPWGSGMMQLIVGGTDKVSGGNATSTGAGCNNTYFQGSSLPRGIYQPWTPTKMFDTADEWITVTVPLANFVYGFDGSQATGSLTADDFSSLTIFVVGGPQGQACQPVIMIDNIRAVPNR